jgi:hypothetical protein
MNRKSSFLTFAMMTVVFGAVMPGVRLDSKQFRGSRTQRFNDRGPYVEGRGVYVSHEVARKLGFDQAGVAKGRVELLEVPSGSASAHHS